MQVGDWVKVLFPGILNPDTFVLDRDTLKIKSCEIGGKEKKIVRDPLAGHGTVEQVTTPAERAASSLTDAQARALAALGRDIMQRYGGLPQDIEWARRDETFYILQARPVTGVEFTWDEDVDGWQTSAIEPDTTWTYTWSEMYWTGGISPLFYSCRAYECYLNYSRFAKLFAFKDITNVRWHKYRRATAYFNADAERSWLAQQWPGQLRESHQYSASLARGVRRPASLEVGTAADVVAGSPVAAAVRRDPLVRDDLRLSRQSNSGCRWPFARSVAPHERRRAGRGGRNARGIRR